MVDFTVSVICIYLFFVFVRAISETIFQRLTAHWLAAGLSASYILGLILFEYISSIEQFESSFRGTPFHHDLAISWLMALIPLNFLVVPILYWWDKRVALKEDSGFLRIPENSLHALAFSGGILGAYIGQKIFKHKVSKESFQTKHYIVCGLSILLYIAIAYNFFTN